MVTDMQWSTLFGMILSDQTLLDRLQEWRCYRRLSHLRQGLHDPIKVGNCHTLPTCFNMLEQFHWRYSI